MSRSSIELEIVGLSFEFERSGFNELVTRFCGAVERLGAEESERRIGMALDDDNFARLLIDVFMRDGDVWVGPSQFFRDAYRKLTTPDLRVV